MMRCSKLTKKELVNEKRYCGLQGHVTGGSNYPLAFGSEYLLPSLIH